MTFFKGSNLFAKLLVDNELTSTGQGVAAESLPVAPAANRRFGSKVRGLGSKGNGEIALQLELFNSSDVQEQINRDMDEKIVLVVLNRITYRGRSGLIYFDHSFAELDHPTATSLAWRRSLVLNLDGCLSAIETAYWTSLIAVATEQMQFFMMQKW